MMGGYPKTGLLILALILSSGLILGGGVTFTQNRGSAIVTNDSAIPGSTNNTVSSTNVNASGNISGIAESLCRLVPSAKACRTDESNGQFTSGPFFIKSKLNGMIIDIANAERGPHGKLQTYPAKDSDNDNQLWSITPEGFIKSKLNGMVIDIAGAERGPHGVLQTYPAKDNDNDNQLWELVPAGGISLPDCEALKKLPFGTIVRNLPCG